ncbi:MAG: hypothetical protein RLZZ502_1417 [Pseudomonadota bacterium]
MLVWSRLPIRSMPALSERGRRKGRDTNCMNCRAGSRIAVHAYRPCRVHLVIIFTKLRQGALNEQAIGNVFVTHGFFRQQ